MIRAILLVGWNVSVALLFGKPQGLIKRIEAPEVAFHDQRKDWVGEEILFLHQEESEQLGKYIGFCWDPEDPRGSVAEYKTLVGQHAFIEEAWWGSVTTSNTRSRKQDNAVVFWKIRCISSDKVVWYWDDGASYISGVGFIRDYELASRHVGDSLWTRHAFILYSMDDEEFIQLRNLEKVVLTDVRWGEYANYPLRFVLKTESGCVGYRSAKNLEAFFRDWHRVNPRRGYKNWEPIYWLAVENRKLTSGMVPEMVRLAWGDPLAEGHVITAEGNQLMLWIYRGINKRIYGLFFLTGKLIYWQWRERKYQNKDLLRFELKNRQICQTCTVQIHWQKMREGSDDFVTFSW